MTTAVPRKTSGPKRKDVDWTDAWHCYRRGDTVTSIAAKHGVSEALVRKHARRELWERDLSGRIADKVRATMVRGTVRQPDDDRTVPHGSHIPSDRETIEMGVSVQVGVLQYHQQRIGRLWEIGEALERRLIMLVDPRNHEDIASILMSIRQIEGGEIEDPDERRTMMKEIRIALARITSLGDHIDLYRTLGNAHNVVADMERVTHGIAGPVVVEAETYEERVKRLAGPLALPAPTET